MRFLFLFFFVLWAKALWTQEPQWTLLRENTSGVIAVDPTNSNIIYINGVLKTTDGGITWTLNNNDFGVNKPFDVIVDPNNPQVVYACGDGLRMGIVKSIDGGLTWFKSDSGIVSDHHGYTVEAMAFDANRNILYAGDFAVFGGLYRSFDGGAYWEQVAREGANLQFQAMDLLVDQQDGTVYVGATDGVWKSNNQAESWIQISNGLPIRSINPFTNDSAYFDIWSLAKTSESKTLYAAPRENGIQRSIDAGENWKAINSGLIENHTLEGGVVVSHVDTNVVFAGGSSSSRQGIKSGLWRSINGGQSWERYHEKLPTSSPNWIVAKNLVIQGDALYLELLGLDFRGIYKLTPTVATAVKDRKNDDQTYTYLLHPNYPNPFTHSTRINYSLTTGCQVTLRILDLEGQEVTTLVERWQHAGSHIILWDGTNSQGGDASNGVYFIQLHTGQSVRFRKMLLIR